TETTRPAPAGRVRQAAAPNRFSAAARRRSASRSRLRGGAVVTSSASRCSVAWAIAWTARSNAASFALEGLVEPLTFRTYWSAAAWISSSVTGGSKLWRVWMFRHMGDSSGGRCLGERGQLAAQVLDLVAELGGVLEAELLRGGEHLLLERDHELLEVIAGHPL